MSNSAKQNLAIVLASTNDMAFAVANVLFGVKDYPPDNDFKLIIFHDGISNKDKILLNQIIPCEFKKYELPDKLKINLPHKLIKSFTEMSFAKYECFNLLNYYTKVIWFDFDILIRGDTKYLLDYCKNGAGFALENKEVEFNFSKSIYGFNMKNKSYNTGVFVLGDNLVQWDEMTEWLYDKTFQYSDYLELADQGVINIMFQEFNVKPENILPKYNYFPHYEENDEALILHAVGTHKFWINFQNNDWNINYKKWLKMGGNRCPAYKIIKDCFCRISSSNKNLRKLVLSLSNAFIFIINNLKLTFNR